MVVPISELQVLQKFLIDSPERKKKKSLKIHLNLIKRTKCSLPRVSLLLFWKRDGCCQVEEGPPLTVCVLVSHSTGVGGDVLEMGKVFLLNYAQRVSNIHFKGEA